MSKSFFQLYYIYKIISINKLYNTIVFYFILNLTKFYNDGQKLYHME